MTVKKNKRHPPPARQPVILSLETSTRICGVALLRGAEPLCSLSFMPASGHSAFLMPAVDAVARLTGLEPTGWDGLAVSRGPGSFTGLRIGMATAKGLALGLSLPLYGIDTLECLALGAAGFARSLVAPVMDARKGQVFAGLYHRTREGLRRVKDPVALEPEALPGFAPPEALFTGDALAVFGDRIRAAYRGSRLALAPPDLWFPDPVIGGRLALPRVLAAEPSELAGLIPLYVRPSDAELNRQRARRAPPRRD